MLNKGFFMSNKVVVKIIDSFLDQPLLAGLFLVNLGILIFHRPPFFFSAIMMGFLVVTSMYYGQKLALFKH